MTSPDSEIQSSEKVVLEIKARAESLGFSLCVVTDAGPLSGFPRYEKWLQERRHGNMTYLNSERHRTSRAAPTNLVPWVKSILVLAWPYRLNTFDESDIRGLIAGYVGAEDYHLSLPRILQPLVDGLPALVGREVRVQIFTDSAPILERELAARAGLGWIGKNSCLINPRFGSAFLLAEVFLDCELPPDAPFQEDHCGTCRRCIDACPTGCILPDHTIDASRCISALTIETRGILTSAEQRAIGNHLFGCDICQSVCPWNSKVDTYAPDACSQSQEQMISLLSIGNEEFRTRFRNSAILRSKRSGLVRNACAVLGNLRSRPSLERLKAICESDPDSVLRVTAGRALLEIDPVPARESIKQFIADETNPQVKVEFEKLLE